MDARRPGRDPFAGLNASSTASAPGTAPVATAATGTGHTGASTHFGFTQVPAAQKAERVAGVFHSVAQRYDVMNDLASLGLHRAWKAFAVRVAAARHGHQVLDIAGGTGDLALAFAREVGVGRPGGGQVWLTDINASMLDIGRDRLIDKGVLLPCVQCDAEKLPFSDGSFDRVSVAFGLRNMTHKDRALAEMARVLKPGGKLLVLEFSKVWKPLAPLYDAYSFGWLPRLGQAVAGDGDSYRYLAESIRMHPDQAELAAMLRAAGFVHVDWHNLAGGIVALHVGVK
jgi:demethylmenaquinone methyltransferase/2-methoxy-6-polyprenyl-1,4-benzoquinol methylase